MVANSEMKHKSKAVLEVIGSSAGFCFLLCYSIEKYLLHVPSAKDLTL